VKAFKNGGRREAEGGGKRKSIFFTAESSFLTRECPFLVKESALLAREKALLIKESALFAKESLLLDSYVHRPPSAFRPPPFFN
jgi:hypothetical protein